jgi:hypothetical protein
MILGMISEVWWPIGRLTRRQVTRRFGAWQETIKVFEKTYVLAFAVLVVLAGCSSDSTLPGGERLVTVTGVVTHIDDRVPVDGGVTITLELEGGGTELLLFGSLFTSPPPGEERLELYQKIRAAEVGSRVRVAGIRRDEGIELTDMVVLDT